MKKKLLFNGKEFIADKIIKTESAIIFYNNDRESNRLQPISSKEIYEIMYEDNTDCKFD